MTDSKKDLVCFLLFFIFCCWPLWCTGRIVNVPYEVAKVGREFWVCVATFRHFGFYSSAKSAYTQSHIHTYIYIYTFLVRTSPSHIQSSCLSFPKKN